MEHLYEMRRGGFRAAKGMQKSSQDKFMSPSEFAGLLDAARQDRSVYGVTSYDLFFLAGNFCLRCGEALALAFENFASLANGYFRVRTLKVKAGALREDPVAVGARGLGLVRQLLERRASLRRARAGPIFGFTTRSARYYFAYYAARAGISPNVSFHALRHTAARMMLDAMPSVPDLAPKAPFIVNAFLRHRPTTTAIYVLPTLQEMARATDAKGIVT